MRHYIHRICHACIFKVNIYLFLISVYHYKVVMWMYFISFWIYQNNFTLFKRGRMFTSLILKLTPWPSPRHYLKLHAEAVSVVADNLQLTTPSLSQEYRYRFTSKKILFPRILVYFWRLVTISITPININHIHKQFDFKL